MEEQIYSFRHLLQAKLTPMRYEHSLSVSFMCSALAMKHGYPIDKAELAGLLHDCGKRFTNEILIEKCEKHKLYISEEEYKAPSVLHAKYGAWIAEHKYGIKDPEILSAIRYHTTGKPAMNTLEKIVYIADYIEPRRDKASDLPSIRQIAFEDLDLTMYEILAGTVDYLTKRNLTMDSITKQALEYYSEKIGKE